jgi:hypothetical protein
MTDDMKSNEPMSESKSSAPGDEKFAWSEPEPAPASGGQAREWVTQLQAMIENLATQAAPVVREVGAKAAELAALAGEKAGPVAQRAAELTGQAGHKLAEKSRDLAAELRRDAAAARAAETGGTGDTAAEAGESMATEEPPTTAGIP